MKKVLPIFIVLSLSACTTIGLIKDVTRNLFGDKNDNGVYKIGSPYKIGRKWYYPKEEPDYKEIGTASWYGSKFHNKRTANGEKFDKNKVSAAHRTLPMPSIVKVTNLENGKAMLIRVNDRGPFAHDRIIDLSEKSAKLLGVYQKGTAKVKVEFDKTATIKMLKKEGIITNYTPPLYKERKRSVRNYGHFIQIGAYSSYENAKSAALIAKKATDVFVKKSKRNGGVIYKVQTFKTIDNSDDMLKKLVKLGFYDAIIVKN